MGMNIDAGQPHDLNRLDALDAELWRGLFDRAADVLGGTAAASVMAEARSTDNIRIVTDAIRQAESGR